MAHYLELLTFRLENIIGRIDLAAQRGLLYGRRNDVGREREIGGLEFEALILRERAGCFDLSPLGAKDVRCIRNAHSGLIQMEDGSRPRQAKTRWRELLARGLRIRVHRRKEFAALGVEVLLGLPQGRLRRLNARIGTQGLGNKTVEFF